MSILSIRRWLAASMLCISLTACGDSAAHVQPTTAPAAQLPSPSPTQISTPTTAAATATTVPIATAIPATATAVPSTTVAPSATLLPPSSTPTAGVIQAVTVTPALAQPTSVVAATSAPDQAATASPASGGDAPIAGSYVFPVQGGKVNFGTTHHDYPATDMFCPIGSQFVAPTSGVVDYVSRTDQWDPATDDPAVRGGRSVAMIGDDGIRYYGAHLSQVADGIEPGVRVAAGQLLGLTGKSGNARFTPPHLHFGISHPTTPDDWKVRRGQVSPYPYLRAWQAGKQVKPKLN